MSRERCLKQSGEHDQVLGVRREQTCGEAGGMN